jgi:flavin reductase (DIM6/NTAB) family NADH-FMN oxidoreductase RutF
MVASWVSQVSYDPPRIMVAVKKTRFSHELLETAKGFGLMVIEKGKERELVGFKGTDPEGKFEGKEITYGKGGAPLFSDYLCAFDLVTKQKIDAGDHTIFIGDVAGVTMGETKGTPMSTLDYGKVYIGEA